MILGNQKFWKWISILLILMLVNPVFAQTSIELEYNKIPEDENLNKIENENIRTVMSLMIDSELLSSGKKGSVIVYENGIMDIYGSGGELVARIPKGVVLRPSKDRSGLIASGIFSQSVRERGAWTSGTRHVKEEGLEIFGVNIQSKKNSEVEFVNNDGKSNVIINKGVVNIAIRDLEYRGVGPIIKDTEKFKKQPAVFRVDENGELEYALFKSTEKQTYKFRYKGRDYYASIDEEGILLFDGKAGSIKGESVNRMVFEDGNVILGAEENYFEATLNDEGWVKKALVKNGKLSSLRKGEFSSITGELTVVFNKDEFDKLISEGGNIVYVGEEKIEFFGVVSAEGLSASRHFYHGTNEAHNSYDLNEKKFEISSDARFGNANYQIEVEDGEAFFKLRDESSRGVEFEFDINYPTGLTISGKMGPDSGEIFITDAGKSYFIKDLMSEIERGTISSEMILNGKAATSLFEGKKDMYEGILDTLESKGEKGSKKWYEAKLAQLKNKQNIDILSGKSTISKKTYLEILDQINEIKSEIENIDLILETNENEYGGITESGESFSNDAIEKIRSENRENQKRILEEKKEKLLLQYSQFNEYAGDTLLSLLKNGEDSKEYSGDGIVSSPSSFYERAYESGGMDEDTYSLRKIDVNLEYGNYDLAIKEAERIIAVDKNDELTAAAYTRLGMSQFLSGKVELDEAIGNLRVATSFDPNSGEAIYNNEMVALAQIRAVAKLASNEGAASFADISSLTGDFGEGSNWQWAFDTLFLATSPYSVLDQASRIDEFLERANVNIAKADLEAIGADQMGKIIASGKTLASYRQAGPIDRFLMVYQSNNYDDVISTERLERILRNDVLDAFRRPQDKFNKMLELIEEEGISSKSPLIRRRLMDTAKHVALISSLTDKNNKDHNPTLHSLLYQTRFVVPTRSGKPIEISREDYLKNFAKDILVSPANLIGAGLIARGVGASSKSGLQLALRMGLQEGVENTARAWGEVSVNNLVRGYVANVAGDVAFAGGAELAGGGDDPIVRSLMMLAGTTAGVAAFGKGILGGKFAGVGVLRRLDDNKNYLRNFDEKTLGELGKRLNGKPKISADGKVLRGVDKSGNDVVFHLAPKDAKNLFLADDVSRGAIAGRSANARALTEEVDGVVGKTSTLGCFLPNTQILMADGTYKNIEEILLREEVIAYDIFNNLKTSSPVSTTFKRLETKYYQIEYEVIE
ncbi:hypothetical protein CMI42_05205 [Candidatus Pacearchaeota archaeon]|nr:hypothetical protein [Candidatus Pacearchaeota archaeon]